MFKCKRPERKSGPSDSPPSSGAVVDTAVIPETSLRFIYSSKTYTNGLFGSYFSIIVAYGQGKANKAFISGKKGLQPRIFDFANELIGK